MLRASLIALAVLGSVVLLRVEHRHQEALVAADCPPASADEELSALTFELAGRAERARRLLLPSQPATGAASPDWAARICLEARVRFLKAELRELDAGLFMPFYAALTLLLSGHALVTATGGQGMRRVRGGAVIFAATTLVLLLRLDAAENQLTLAQLDLTVASASDGPAPALDALTHITRQVSLSKWFASGLWGLSVTGLVWVSWARAPMAPTRIWCICRAAALVAFLLASSVWMFSAAWSWLDGAATQVKALSLGMDAAVIGLVMTVVLAWLACMQPADSASPALVESPTANGQVQPVLGPAREFHMEEYRQIRAEVTGLLARIDGLLRNTVVACALGYAWLATQSLGVDGQDAVPCLRLPRAMLSFAWALPPCLVLMAGVVVWVLGARVKATGLYLRQLEQGLGAANCGWEGYLQPKRSIVSLVTLAAWVFMLALSVTASSVGQAHAAQAKGACGEGSAKDKAGIRQAHTAGSI